MSEFQLISDFKPTGDQPQAIDALSHGVSAGLKHQTLLGVTGSGKSVVGNTQILVRKGTRAFCEEIGPLIDGLMAREPGQIRYAEDAETELLEAAAVDQPTEVFSFDPMTGQSSWKPVRQFLRHRSPEALSRVRTACGRTVTVTGDHNFFVLRGGQLRLVRTEEIQPGDCLPLPRKIPEPAEPLVTLPLEEQFETTDRVYVGLDGFANKWATHRAVLQPLLSRPKAYALVQGQERVSLRLYHQLVTAVPTLAAGVSFGTIKRKYSAPGTASLTPTLLRLLGYYVAEGHGETGCFIVSSAEDAVISDMLAGIGELNLGWHHPPGTYDYRISSTARAIDRRRVYPYQKRSRN